MKKLITLILAAILMLSLAACGGGGGGDAPSTRAGGDDTETDDQTPEEPEEPEVNEIEQLAYACAIDIIEERTQVRDLTLKLNLPKEVRKAVLVPENKELKPGPGKDKSFTIPLIDGYTILELSY